MRKLQLVLIALFWAGFGFGQTFNGGTGVINDLMINDFTLTVSGLNPPTLDTTNFGLQTICINLTHTYDSDLQISLIAPDGTTVLLAGGIGGGDDNFTNTCFNDGGAMNITAGTAPFTGTFRSQGQMGLVNNGQVGNGVWTLRIHDTAGGDVGDLLGWSIQFGNQPATYTSFSSSNLPIVVINTNGQGIVQNNKITADLGIIYNGPGMRNHLTDPKNNYNGKVGIEERGNFSSILPQKPYDFETRDINGNNLNTSLLGLPTENDWILLAAYNDKSFMLNELPYYFFQQMGHWASNLRLCEVVLNGDYQGVYMLGEKIKRDANRVDIANLTATDISWPDVSGGYILKTDYYDNSNSWLLNYHPIDHPTFDVHMVYVYPKAADIVPQQRTYIQGFIDDMETALYSNTFTDTTNGYRKYLSIRSFIDYFLVNELSRNNDGFKKSVYFYKEKDNADGTIGKLKAGPVWDFDWAWKNIPGCVNFSATDGSGWAYLINDCNPDINGTGWYVRLLQDSAFANQVQCRWTQLRQPGALLDTTQIWAFMDSIASLSMESQQRHYALWGHMGASTGTPEIDPPATSYPEEVARLKAWIRLRISWMDANLPGSLSACNLVANEAPAPDNAIQTYPNPFHDRFAVAVRRNSPAEIQMSLLNVLGQEVLPQQSSYHTGNGEMQLTWEGLSRLPQGQYILRLKAGDQIWTQRLVKVD